MGGLAGHMMHLYDNPDLKFSQMMDIFKAAANGELEGTEKTDGQNLMITYRDGKVLAARNKGQIKNRGQNALDVNAVAKKFSGRGDIKDAFVFAMKDLSRAINSLNIILKILNEPVAKIDKAWELNERHYGDLTGLNKDETIKKYGNKQVQIWRRSFDVSPPSMESKHPYQNKIYSTIPKNAKIKSESLKDTF